MPPRAVQLGRSSVILDDSLQETMPSSPSQSNAAGSGKLTKSPSSAKVLSRAGSMRIKEVPNAARGSVRAPTEVKGDNDEDKEPDLDTSMLDQMSACAEEGTVLARVEDWIADLENKYVGGYSREVDPIVVKDDVRRFISNIPFPSWDGKEDIILRSSSPVESPTQHHDYGPELLGVDNEPEDADEDDRDAGERLVRAYSNSCLQLHKSALPLAIEVLSRRKADKLLVPNCSIADSGLFALGPFLGQIQGLATLDLSTNMIFDEGATALAKALKGCTALTSLILDNNKIGTYGATALGEQFKGKRSNLTFLSVRHNQLSDAAVSAIVDALAQRKKIITLVLSQNSIGQQSCSSLATLLRTTQTLQHLDCHWGHMRKGAAVEFAEALVEAHQLQYLDLAWNGFGDLVPCSKLADAMKLPTCAIQHLDLSHNRLNEQSAFLVAGPLEFNKSLTRLILDGNPVGQSGCRRIMQSCLGFKNSLETQQKDDRTVNVSLKDCSFGMVSPSSFDPAEPAGEYLFDMSDPYSRLVVRDLLKIEALGKGQFQRHTVSLDWEPYNLKKMEDFDKEAEVPVSGEMGFRFISLRKPPWAGGDTELHSTVFDSLLEHFTKNTKLSPGEHRMGKVEYLRVLITADTVFSYEQACALIVHLASSEEKVSFMAEIYHKFNEADGNKRCARENLTEAEQKRLRMLLGPTAFAFTPNNPTGHHHLDLSTKEERDVGIKILDARNGNEDAIKRLQEKMTNRQGGPRDTIEMCWLSASVNGQPIHYERHLTLPRNGIMELDFVSILKPQDIDPKVDAISTGEWNAFVELMNSCESLFEVVGEFRELSNTKVFRCIHVREILAFLDVKDDELKSRPSTPAVPGVHKERTLDLQKFRVEVCVVAFARTLDYFGFYGIYGLFQTDLSRAERYMLQERIGVLNMFLSEMAVNYYELDLANKSERWIMQELVHLAIAEPGQNCMNETYNDMDFPIPSTWSKEVPRKGVFTCYYCREQDTINKICTRANERHAGSVPVDVKIPALVDWVYSAKCHQIKQKMADKFSSAKACFKAVDKDGGGSIDRREMAGGLFKLGVWLRPTELATLFAAVDEDGGGDVDFPEFESFWLKW